MMDVKVEVEVEVKVQVVERRAWEAPHAGNAHSILGARIKYVDVMFCAFTYKQDGFVRSKA